MSRRIERVTIAGRRGGEATVLPVLCWRGTRPGPSVLVTASLHGDEVVGAAVVHRLDAWLTRTLGQRADVELAGALALFPSCNPDGLAVASRVVPADGLDLNRSFPGSARGGPSSRLAAAIWRDVCARKPDVLIDLHADAPLAVPYVIVDRPLRHAGGARRELADRLLRLAGASGLTVLREYPDELYVQIGLDRSLAGAVVNLLGVPALTMEVGPRRHVAPDAVHDAFRSLLGVLAAAGSLPVVNEACTDALPHPSRVAGMWRRAASPRARRGGLLRPLLPPGGRFAEGQPMAQLVGLSGAVEEEILGPAEGVVVSWVEGGWIAAGGVVATVGIRDEERL